MQQISPPALTSLCNGNAILHSSVCEIRLLSSTEQRMACQGDTNRKPALRLWIGVFRAVGAHFCDVRNPKC